MHIFELDTITTAPDELQSLAQAYVLEAGVKFTARAIEILKLEQAFRLTYLVAAATFSAPENSSVVSVLNSVAGGYRQASESLLAGRAQAEAALQRNSTLALWDAFELFLGDCLTVLFYAFPRFLTTPPENIVLPTTHYDDLFGTTSVLQTRLAIAQRKVSQLLQSENVFDLLKKTEQRFGVSLSALSEPDRKALLEFSARRNLWIHNAGVVNDIYLRLLRRYGVSSSASEGALAPVDQLYLNAARDITNRASLAFSKGLAESVPQIRQHHANM